MKKSFYAYMSRLKHIKRWGLMRNTIEENVQEHSFHVALISHALCIIKNVYFGGKMDEGQVLKTALYHEAAEAITGDLPTPIKYFDEDIKSAYKRIERHAEHTLVDMLPLEMSEYIAPYVLQEVDSDVKMLVKAADRLCAYIKCIEEKKSGNTEFLKAQQRILETITNMNMPEADFFMEHFIAGYELTLDELNS
ncbi:MAG: 5'-deoxynucleotidase [Christensenellaceae bacterium]